MASASSRPFRAPPRVGWRTWRSGIPEQAMHASADPMRSPESRPLRLAMVVNARALDELTINCLLAVDRSRGVELAIALSVDDAGRPGNLLRRCSSALYSLYLRSDRRNSTVAADSQAWRAAAAVLARARR